MSNQQKLVSDLTTERDKLSERLASLGVIGDPAELLQKELDSTRSQLDSATRELTELRVRTTEMESELSLQTSLAQETQSRYETEVMRCGQTTKTVQALREKLSGLDRDKSELEIEKRQTSDVIDGLKKNCKNLEEKFVALKSQHALVEDENRALHEQVNDKQFIMCKSLQIKKSVLLK